MEDVYVLRLQRDSLITALTKVLDANDKEAKTQMSYQTARENFSDDSYERKAYETAMLDAMSAERETRTLLLTMRAAS